MRRRVKENTPTVIQPQSVGFAFIKSGYEDVEENLCEDFAKYGLETIHSTSVLLDPEVIDYVYRDSRERHFYNDMKQHLTTHTVKTLILFHANKNAQMILHKLKTGSGGFENLRAKYRHLRIWIRDEELRRWEAGIHEKQLETTIALTQDNVFHAADSTEEAIKSIQLLERTTEGFYTREDLNSGKIRGLLRVLTRLKH